MKKEKYDLVFCLGVGCSGTQLLREAGLQLATFPLDWVGRGTIRARTEIVLGEFADWLKQDQLELLEVAPDGVNDLYLNRINGQEIAHDFPTGRPLSETFPVVKDKYDRRIARFLQLLEKSRKVLIVWMGDARVTDPIAPEEVKDCLQAFSGKYRKTKFRMLVLDYRKGVPAERPERTQGEDFEIVGLDFRDYADGNWIWAVHSEMLIPYLEGISVKDYRPASVRREFRLKRKRAEYERFKATSVFDLFLTKLAYRICKQIWKRLEKKGVEVVRPAEALKNTGLGAHGCEHKGRKEK